MADEQRRAPELAAQLADQLEENSRVCAIELAGRLVGEEESRPMRQGGADRNTLLLSAGELVRPRRAPVEEANTLEQRVRTPEPRGARLAAQPQRNSDELTR